MQSQSGLRSQGPEPLELLELGIWPGCLRIKCDGVLGMAHPWWVNLLVAVPLFSYVFWQRASISFTRSHLLAAALFAASFGVVEGTVVVYLRAVLGAAAGYSTSLSGVAQFSESLSQARLEPAALPPSLLRVKVFREAATIFMLVSVGLLAAPNRQGRWAMFLWTFAIWDVTYYVTLWAIIRWPSSITDSDVLFLIPVVWVSPVWFPLLVSTLSAGAVLLASRPILRPDSR